MQLSIERRAGIDRMIRAYAALLVVLTSFPFVATAATQTNLVVIDARKPAPAPAGAILQMGGRSSSGHEIRVESSQYLVLDGKPWLPVMGEFHYSRYPEQYWEEELLKMKAGGIQVIASYLFWNHHEEIEGQFDWSGRRDLRRFVQLCQKDGLYVFLRIGPWSHGEVRNGGFPDWLLAKVPERRRNDPQYLFYVRRYFGQIGKQVKGLLWKDGGPIIGIQFENEYYERGPDAGAAHISELKKIARESGIEAPLYTVTGWGNPDFPAGEVIPVFGGYPDDFWESTLSDSPPSGYYLFESKRDNGEMGGPSPSQKPTNFEYPYFMAEAGGGMQVAYHRRPVIQADDVAAIALTRIGSGVNLYGYYVFQGGSNPEGKRTSLQESVESDKVYDLPVVSYDFQAPLGEFGQTRNSYRALKELHLFLHDFGKDLAPMNSYLPEVVPANASDRNVVRAAARFQGDRGFLFVNNYLRNYPLPDRSNVQFQLKLPSETVLLPRHPIAIRSGLYFIWPVNLDMSGATLHYATAQPVTRIRAKEKDYYFFVAQPGIESEFVFDEGSLISIHADQAETARSDGKVYVNKIRPGSDVAFRLRSKAGSEVFVVVLTPDQAQNLWKPSMAGEEHVLLSPADIFCDSDRLYLRAREVERLHFSLFPDFGGTPKANAPLQQAGNDGVFVSYSATVASKKVPVRWEKIREARPSEPVKKGQYNAMAPSDADFERAAQWRIHVPLNALDGLSDVYLQIEYSGDVARLFAGRHLLADDFYKGTTWEIGLKRFPPKARESLELRVMPLRKDAPIYLPRTFWPTFPASQEIAGVSAIRAVPEYEVRVDFSPRSRPGPPLTK